MPTASYDGIISNVGHEQLGLDSAHPSQQQHTFSQAQHQQHGTLSQQTHQTQGEQHDLCGGSEDQDGSGNAQEDLLTHQLRQLLITDMSHFWTTTVAPSTQAIAQCSLSLQKEASDLGGRAEAELQEVISELTRVHSLVASFQDQIREALSMMQG